MNRKTFIGRVLSVTQSAVVMSTIDPARGDAIALQAGAVVLERARALVGRTVRYTAEVSSETRCLSNPQFVIGSEYGLVAVANPLDAAIRTDPDIERLAYAGLL